MSGIDIWLGHGDSKQHVVTHQCGAFSGDIDLLSGKAVVVSATSHGASTLIELPSDVLRSVVVESSLSDIIVAAFLARRAFLLNESNATGGGHVVVVGPDHDAGTHHIRDFQGKINSLHLSAAG